jgi:hypothetical protein
MKRILAIILTLIGLFSLFACNSTSQTGGNTTSESTTISTTQPTTNTTMPSASNLTTTTLVTTTTVMVATKPLPTYKPGSIKLDDGGLFEEFPIEPHYRWVYYGIGGGIHTLVDDEKADEWIKNFDKQWPNGEERTKMIMAHFLKDFNIPKQVFIDKVNKTKQVWLDGDVDLTQEEWELPNADIIYTFDDEIINNYYRRK